MELSIWRYKIIGKQDFLHGTVIKPLQNADRIFSTWNCYLTVTL